MLSSSTFDFLRDLKENNDRDWFNDNKPRFEAAKTEFEDFIGQLIFAITAFDPEVGGQEAKKCIFRIYRDTRFSKDKSPYKTNFGAHIGAFAAKPHDRAGYYVHLEPGNSFLAGGAYQPPAPWLKAIRQEIDYNGPEFREILNGKEFTGYFGVLQGEKLQKAPKDYPPDHPDIELLKYKSFVAMHRVDDGVAQSDGFLIHTAKVFRALQPFDAFLNRAMENG